MRKKRGHGRKSNMRDPLPDRRKKYGEMEKDRYALNIVKGSVRKLESLSDLPREVSKSYSEGT